MRKPLLRTLLIAFSAIAAACGGTSNTGNDASRDTNQTEAAAETGASEAGNDAIVEDTAPDVVVTDAQPDVVSNDALPDTISADTTPPDVSPDVPPPDVAPDVVADAPSEAGPPDVVSDAMVCTMGQTRCGELCIDTQTNAQNCGTCGTVCGAGQMCVMGSCSCPSGTTMCGTGMAARCVATDSSAENCGMCGRTCAAGQSCTMGMCTCPMGQTLCGGACVDTATTEANCGMCGNVCPEGQRCVAGACACPMGQTRCGMGSSATCVTTNTDNNNCGACGTVCPMGTTCTMGTCTCPMGQTLCGMGAAARCVDANADAANCGMCGNACPMGQVCNAGRCAVTCSSPRMVCGTGAAMVCTDVQADENNCGMCGNRCGITSNAQSASCLAGSCSLICRTNYGNCDGNYANGCETDITMNANNCGGCGNVCPSTLPNASSVTCRINPASNAPSCRPICSGTFSNCDQVDANGCESNTQTDVNNCGACGNQCAAGEACVTGTCTATSCRDLRTRAMAAGTTLMDGMYTIDPDGPAGAVTPFPVYCDMTTDGGGWTLILARQGLTYGTSTTEGDVTVGSNRHLSTARVTALAAVSQQVHIRNPGQAATRSITSTANGLAIQNLRMGRILNHGMAGITDASMASQTNVTMHWSGPFAQASRLWFTCGVNPHAGGTVAWPSIYWACNNTNGLHFFSTVSSWVWTPGTGTAEERMEAYVR